MTDVAGFMLSPACWAVKDPGFKPQDLPGLDTFGDEEVVSKKLKSGIDVRVTQDGFFTFDFSDTIPGAPDQTNVEFDDLVGLARRRVQAMNCYLACLYTSIVEIDGYSMTKMLVTPRSLVAVREDSMSFGGPDAWGSFAHRYQKTRGVNATGLLTRHNVLSLEVLDRSFELLDLLLLEKDDNLLVLTELLLRSVAALEDHDFPLGLVTAWAVCEFLTQRLWQVYISHNSERKGVRFLDAERVRRLKDGRTYTAAVILEVLSLEDVLPLSLYKRLTTVRTARNGWLHQLRPIGREDAQQSVEAAQEMLKMVEHLDWRLHPAIAVHG